MDEPLTASELRQLECATRHVMDTYRLPRYGANYVAVHLLAMGWLPTCSHERRHYFSNQKRRGRERPVPWYVRPVPERELGVNDACMFAEFRFLWGA
jgi:hypothetical protein